MSLYKDASLVMIPTAYKDGKLYSIRPTDGSGDFTFSRGSNLAATRVDVNGLIEKGRENLLLQSNQLDTTWLNVNTSETGGQTGYDGSSDAWLISKTAGNARIYQNITTSGVKTFSVYAKAGSLSWMRLRLGSAPKNSRYFDLTNGVIGSGGIAPIDATITSVGGGWYRCSITTNISIDTAFIYPAQGDNDLTATSGNIYIQDAQLEQGLVATDYIETTTTSVSAGILEDMPRLDYSGGASCPSLLLEPQRTNLISQSEFYGGSDWARTRCGFVTNTSETLSPEGLYNASKMTSTDASESYAQDNVTLGSTSGTFTFFAKKGDLDYCHALVWDISANGRRQWFNLATGAVGTTTNFGSGYTKVDATIEDYGNGWYRCSFSWSGGNTTSGVRINISSGDGVIGSPINSYGYFYGAQCEASVSYPTSYIPTYGTSQTRSAEEYCKVNNIGDFPNEYTLFFEMEDIEASQNNSVIMDLYSTTANTISVRTYETSGDGRLRFVDIVNNSTLFYLEHTSRKYCIRVNGTSVDGFTNGALAVSATAGSSMNNLDDLNIRCGSAQRSLSKYKQIVAFPTALTDSECIALTTI